MGAIGLCAKLLANFILSDNHKLRRSLCEKIACTIFLLTNIGGIRRTHCAIETTIRWHHFAAADNLLEKWVDKAIEVNDENAILDFGESVFMKNRFWTVARLLEKSLSSSKKWGQKRFNAELLRCIALHKIYEMLQNPDKVKKGLSMVQANWVSYSTNIDKLNRTLNESIGDAKKTFANFAEPTPKQNKLWFQLNQICQKFKNTSK
jgi:hypothetical protein